MVLGVCLCVLSFGTTGFMVLRTFGDMVANITAPPSEDTFRKHGEGMVRMMTSMGVGIMAMLCSMAITALGVSLAGYEAILSFL